MNYRLVTGPSTEPLTYAEAKAYLRLNDDSEQSLVTSLISAARGIVEGQTWRPLISQVWATQLDFNEVNTSVIRINKAPVISVDTVTYYDSNNALQTLSATNWESDIYGSPARVRLKTPPIVYERMNALQINFTAGYANAAAVPNDIKTALYMIIGHLYEVRMEVAIGNIVQEIPMASKYLLEPYRNSLLSAYQN